MNSFAAKFGPRPQTPRIYYLESQCTFLRIQVDVPHLGGFPGFSDIFLGRTERKAKICQFGGGVGWGSDVRNDMILSDSMAKVHGQQNFCPEKVDNEGEQRAKKENKTPNAAAKVENGASKRSKQGTNGRPEGATKGQKHDKTIKTTKGAKRTKNEAPNPKRAQFKGAIKGTNFKAQEKGANKGEKGQRRRVKIKVDERHAKAHVTYNL